MTTHGIDHLDPQEQAEIEAFEAEIHRLAREQDRSDLCWLMSDKRGRRIMWRLLEQAGVFRTSFTAPNAMTVSYNEGRRTIGLAFLAEVHDNCPVRYNDMVKEHQEHARDLSKRRDQSRSVV